MNALVDRILLQVQAGTLDATYFDEQMWNASYPHAVDYVRGLFLAAGPFSSLVPLQQEDAEGERNYRYRALFGERSIIITLSLDETGKISNMGVEQE